MELTRKQAIEELKAILEMQYENVPLSKAALEMAISSLKADEAYQIMYEGEEIFSEKIFTKADLVDMLTEIQLELDEMKITKVRSAGFAPYSKDPFRRGVNCSKEVIQQKINKLEENKDNE